ncbi:hypothetical protein L9F63_017257, partial [Diploptera punctata]
IEKRVTDKYQVKVCANIWTDVHFIIVHLLREKLELCNKYGAHATVVHLEIHRDMRGVYGDDCMDPIPQN